MSQIVSLKDFINFEADSFIYFYVYLVGRLPIARNNSERERDKEVTTGRLQPFENGSQKLHSHCHMCEWDPGL